MINNLKSLVSNAFYAPTAQNVQNTQNMQAVHGVQPISVGSPSNYNTSGNPFVNRSNENNSYGINKPVKGGYFAGYYNGKPNIVGQKLFIEA